MSESSETAATTDGELVSPGGTQGGKSSCPLAATGLQPLPMVSPEGTQDVKTQDAGEVPIKGMTSVSPDSCIFLYREKC